MSNRVATVQKQMGHGSEQVELRAGVEVAALAALGDLVQQRHLRHQFRAAVGERPDEGAAQAVTDQDARTPASARRASTRSSRSSTSRSRVPGAVSGSPPPVARAVVHDGCREFRDTLMLHPAPTTTASRFRRPRTPRAGRRPPSQDGADLPSRVTTYPDSPKALGLAPPCFVHLQLVEFSTLCGSVLTRAGVAQSSWRLPASARRMGRWPSRG